MDKKIKSGIFGSYRDMGKIDPKEELRKELAREKRIEQIKLAEKEEDLAKRKDMVAQLKGAFPDIEKNLLNTISLRDITLFTYHYYRCILSLNASVEMSLEALESICALPSVVNKEELPSKLDLMDKLLPREYEYYKRDIFLGAYTVNDLRGAVKIKLSGRSDCTEDFFTNHCKICN